MSNVIKFTAKAKIDSKKIVEKGQTKAKTATTPLGKQMIAEHIKRMRSVTTLQVWPEPC